MKKKSTSGKEGRLDLFLRRSRWLFVRSGIISLAFEHFLAMIPATILVPVLVNNAFGTMVVDISLVLLTSGIGTILFLVCSRGRIPAYVGSSFAYIGLTIYLIQEQMNGDVSHAMAFSYVGWAYIFSGLLLILLSFLYRKKGIERLLSFLLPASVVGPAISLIGLELADTAVLDAGFDIEEGMVDSNAALIAIVTLVIIVLFSLFHHKILKNAAILVGMVVGTLLSFTLTGFPTESFSNLQWFDVPNFHFPVLTIPQNLLGLFISVIPATFIVFTENIGRVTIISRMTEDSASEEEQKKLEDAKKQASHSLIPTDHAEVIDDDTGENELFTAQSVKKMHLSLFAHGIATFVAGFLGSVPNTLYAENIAVMSIHKTDIKREDPDPFIKKLVDPCSIAPFIGAAIIAILFSFVGVLQTFLLEIPKPVIGGMELFLFGIISAPGIQLLVEQRVNYKKVSNQIITAAVLISGISGLSINLGIVELEGMSLGFVIGVLLNLLVQFFKWIGNTSDIMTFEELLAECLSTFSPSTELRVLGYKKEGTHGTDYEKNCCICGLAYALSGKDCRVRMPDGEWVSDDTLRDEIKHCELVEVGFASQEEEPRPILRFRKTANGLFVDILSHKLPAVVRTSYLNDYEAIDEDGDWLLVNASESIPLRRVKALVQMVETNESKK